MSIFVSKDKYPRYLSMFAAEIRNPAGLAVFVLACPLPELLQAGS